METAGSLIPLLCAALLLSYGDVDAVVDVTGIIGMSVVLEVNPPPPENSGISWNFNTQIVAENLPPPPVCNDQLIGKCQFYVNGSLKIDSVSSANNGSYFLIVRSPGSTTSDITEYQLRVYAPLDKPVLRIISDSMYVVSGTNVTLLCEAGGQTVTTYTFYRDQKPICTEPHVTCRGSSLDFTPISEIYNGSYTCRIQNPVSSNLSDPITVTVSGRPDGEISCPVTSNGDILSLVCSWENGRPPANVTMTFNGTTEMNPNIVTRNVSSKTLIWGSVLNCSGDQLGRTSSCLQVLEPPSSPGHNNNTIQEVTEGGSVTLTINLMPKRTSSNAVSAEILPATFTWYKDKTEIKSGVTSTNYSSNLHISEVTPANSGRYECTARNVIGSETFIFNVNVTARAVPPDNGLNGGEIAGIVIGVLAGLTIIGIIIFFIVKKKKRHDDDRRLKDSTDQIDTIQYAEVALNKENGGVAETSMTTKPTDDKDELKYAVINFQNKSSIKPTAPAEPQETVYSDVKNASKR